MPTRRIRKGDPPNHILQQFGGGLIVPQENMCPLRACSRI
jgi:hypothetical protein